MSEQQLTPEVVDFFCPKLLSNKKSFFTPYEVDELGMFKILTRTAQKTI